MDRYQQSGVDLHRQKKMIEGLSQAINATYSKEVIPMPMGFAGFYRLRLDNYQQPTLVSATDGVGTKKDLAIIHQKAIGLGEDLVAMVFNDMATSLARPLFFLDYLSVARIDPDIHSEVLQGIAIACRLAGASLIGGETAEHPIDYPHNPQHIDLAGFGVGLVEQNAILPKPIPRDRLPLDAIGLSSSGLHSNGFSLIHELAKEDPRWVEDHIDELLKPTHIYADVLQSIEDLRDRIYAIAHITGGGFDENIARVLPSPDLCLVLYRERFPHTQLFPSLLHALRLDDEEAFRIFNMGVGMVLIVEPSATESIIARINGRAARYWEKRLALYGDRIEENPHLQVEKITALRVGSVQESPACPKGCIRYAQTVIV